VVYDRAVRRETVSETLLLELKRLRKIEAEATRR
jgi:hypothetical protein